MAILNKSNYILITLIFASSTLSAMDAWHADLRNFPQYSPGKSNDQENDDFPRARKRPRTEYDFCQKAPRPAFARKQPRPQFYEHYFESESDDSTEHMSIDEEYSDEASRSETSESDSSEDQISDTEAYSIEESYDKLNHESIKPQYTKDPETGYLYCNYKDCSYKTKYLTNLYPHWRSHINYKPYSCECGYATARPRDFKRHKESHENKKPKKLYPCDIPGCFYAAARQDTLRGHKDRMHLNKKPTYCTMCKRNFKTPNALGSHMRMHEGNSLNEPVKKKLRTK